MTVGYLETSTHLQRPQLTDIEDILMRCNEFPEPLLEKVKSDIPNTWFNGLI